MTWLIPHDTSPSILSYVSTASHPIASRLHMHCDQVNRDEFELERQVLYRVRDSSPYIVQIRGAGRQRGGVLSTRTLYALAMDYASRGALLQYIIPPPSSSSAVASPPPPDTPTHRAPTIPPVSPSSATAPTHRAVLPPDVARTYAHQLLDGVRGIHASGLAHRDLKAENILVHEDWSLRIADFGLACERSMSGNPVGTRGYMAPEVVALAIRLDGVGFLGKSTSSAAAADNGEKERMLQKACEWMKRDV